MTTMFESRALRQEAHAVSAVRRTGDARRTRIRFYAEFYLRGLARGHRAADARDMWGTDLVRLLGVARPVDLPALARAVLAELDARVDRLTAAAEATGQPALVALAHMLGIDLTAHYEADLSDDGGATWQAWAGLGTLTGAEVRRDAAGILTEGGQARADGPAVLLHSPGGGLTRWTPTARAEVA
ncbi:hypothetical protein [Streptomyces sp. MP131-18]|uniref:hypothetical protein n=1 Tax=Streptomyces sp. MP131-18 TaxID=1857892 RepID=UPI00097C781D|nr:hypothetical protein [Streptomyces sp. MP131-18]ONK09263.1 hypothetical protein STBA_71180 [Streptomyces sp. MP131-18]